MGFTDHADRGRGPRGADMPGDEYADVRPMIELHRALRREFRLLPALVRGVPDADTGRAPILAEHIDFPATTCTQTITARTLSCGRSCSTVGPGRHHNQIDQFTEQIAETLTGWRTCTGSTVGAM